jgi:hypothetical protein
MDRRAPGRHDAVHLDDDEAPCVSLEIPDANGPPVRSRTLRRANSITAAIRA